MSPNCRVVVCLLQEVTADECHPVREGEMALAGGPTGLLLYLAAHGASCPSVVISANLYTL